MVPPAAAVSHRQPAAGPLDLGRAVAEDSRGNMSGGELRINLEWRKFIS